MRAKALAERRARNQELARIDRANRCLNCLKDLKVGHVEVIGVPGRFCSEDCLDSARELAGRKGMR